MKLGQELVVARPSALECDGGRLCRGLLCNEGEAAPLESRVEKKLHFKGVLQGPAVREDIQQDEESHDEPKNSSFSVPKTQDFFL